MRLNFCLFTTVPPFMCYTYGLRCTPRDVPFLLAASVVLIIMPFAADVLLPSLLSYDITYTVCYCGMPCTL